MLDRHRRRGALQRQHGVARGLGGMTWPSSASAKVPSPANRSAMRPVAHGFADRRDERRLAVVGRLEETRRAERRRECRTG